MAVLYQEQDALERYCICQCQFVNRGKELPHIYDGVFIFTVGCNCQFSLFLHCYTCRFLVMTDTNPFTVGLSSTKSLFALFNFQLKICVEEQTGMQTVCLELNC